MKRSRFFAVLLSVCTALECTALERPGISGAEQSTDGISNNEIYDSDTIKSDDNISDKEESTAAPVFPETFDMREHGTITSVKDQGDYGLCWAFSAIGAAESSLVRKDPLIDLSELHLSYFTFNGEDSLNPTTSPDFFEAGGHTSFLTSTFSKWAGPVSEALLPYDTSTDEIVPDMKFISDYHLKNAVMVNSYSEFKLAGIYGNERIKFSDDEIKEMILSGKPVIINFNFDFSVTYDTTTFSQYCSTAKNPTHSVILTGWDDNYPAENFLNKPAGNGAWLAKNSWGTQWGDNGYFWISYYDQSISDTSVLEFESNSEYNNCYYYDSAYSGIITADNTNMYEGYMANVFTADSDSAVTAAGFYTTDKNTSYEITVYTDLQDENDPTSGTKGRTTYGTQMYPGYYTVKLDKASEIKQGEIFSVVVKLSNPEKEYPIPVEASIINAESDITNLNISCIEQSDLETTMSAPGQSFISSNGISWTDTYGIKMDKPQTTLIKPGLYNAYYLGNVCLKAFTEETDHISFSERSGKIAFGTAVSLDSVNNSAIYYTTDGTDPDKTSYLYSDPIVIEEDTIIKARIYRNGKPGTVYTGVYTQACAALSDLTINKEQADLKSSGAQQTFSVSAYEKDIVLLPVSTGKITINGKEIPSGKEYILPDAKAGNNHILIEVSEEGKTSSKYEFDVFKNYAFIDYFSETISFDEGSVFVTDENGNTLKNGESITDLLGQTLFVEYNGDRQKIDLTAKVALENYLDDFIKINYNINCIEGICHMDKDTVYSNSPDMSDPRSVTERQITKFDEYLFEIYPESDKDLYFQIPATYNRPASSVIHFHIDDRPTFEDDSLSVFLTDDNRVSMSIANDHVLNVYYKLEIKQSTSQVYTTDIPAANLLSKNHTYLSEPLKSGETYSLYVMLSYDAEIKKYQSMVKEIVLKVPGDTPKCSFNYEEEKIIFDDTMYTVTGPDGNSIQCFEKISDLLGQTIIFTDKEGITEEIVIPDRPAPPDIEEDQCSSVLRGSFSDDILMDKRYKNGYIKKAMLELKNLFVSTNYPTDLSEITEISVDNFYCNKSFAEGETVLFYIKDTDTSFRSEYYEFTIPKLEKTNKKDLDIKRVTESSVILENAEGCEYGIKRNFEDDYEWQDSPVFNGLKSNKQYVIGIRKKGSGNSWHSETIENVIRTLPKAFVSGDLNNDGSLSVSDAIILKRILSSNAEPDSQQFRAGDMNSDEKINVFDMIRLRRALTEQ